MHFLRTRPPLLRVPAVAWSTPPGSEEESPVKRSTCGLSEDHSASIAPRAKEEKVDRERGQRIEKHHTKLNWTQ